MDKIEFLTVFYDGETQANHYRTEQSFGDFKVGQLVRLGGWKEAAPIERIEHVVHDHKPSDSSQMTVIHEIHIYCAA